MQYVKDFDNWIIKKKHINARSEQPFFREREIWWCSLGCNIGSEEDGKNTEFERPVVVFRMFGKDILWIIPLTTQLGRPDSRLTYTFVCGGLWQTADISQIRLVSSKRLLRYMELISFEDFQVIRNRLRDLV